jgi:hypothetical protein
MTRGLIASTTSAELSGSCFQSLGGGQHGGTGHFRQQGVSLGGCIDTHQYHHTLITGKAASRPHLPTHIYLPTDGRAWRLTCVGGGRCDLRSLNPIVKFSFHVMGLASSTIVDTCTKLGRCCFYFPFLFTLTLLLYVFSGRAVLAYLNLACYCCGTNELRLGIARPGLY